MGVPAFFKWLTTRYPQVVIEALSAEDLEYLRAEYVRENNRRRRETGEDGEDFDPSVLI